MWKKSFVQGLEIDPENREIWNRSKLLLRKQIHRLK